MPSRSAAVQPTRRRRHLGCAAGMAYLLLAAPAPAVEGLLVLDHVKLDDASLAGALTGGGQFGLDIAGLGDVAVDDGDAVAKVGRTTGKTTGRVTAFELDRFIVEFDIGLLRFDDQIEIDGADEMFSDGGDSGSLILDADRRAVALLFAGTETGGTGNLGLTYANPLHPVLDALNAELFR